MESRLPLGLGLALASVGGTWLVRQRSQQARVPVPPIEFDATPWLHRAADLGARAGSSAGWARDRAGEIDLDTGELRLRAAELGTRVGETAAELGVRAGETVAELGARAGETAATIGPVVGRLASEAGEVIGEAGSQAATLAGSAVGGLTGFMFRMVRDLTILGAAGAVIVYLYAPEREQQQELIENAQGIAFGLADLARGVQQLVDDLRAS